MSLISFAYENGLAATKLLSRVEQKKMGQFMTPPAIARAMAKRACSGLHQKVVHMLEPSAGAGILAAAAVEELLNIDVRPTQICITLFEIDGRLLSPLKCLADKMRRAGNRAGVRITVSIRIEDFLMSDIACERQAFDLVIANPPYFKLNKLDERSVKHAYAVYGQPNVYGLFMAACARLLANGGRWCFITPRSWTNGTYFAMARQQMLMRLHIDAIHVFESRQDHFTDDEVLQEAVITWATAKTGLSQMIVLSTSEGISDLATATLRSLPACEVIATDNQSVISLPTSLASSVFSDFQSTLSTFGIKASTGPVVAFRASKYLTEDGNKRTVPLLWMQHVTHMRISWPIRKKREHIASNADTAWMLVPNVNMVVMRRFSPKEDIRRITAAPYLEGSIPGDVLGLENHTNYLYRPGGALNKNETKGLAAFLNSRIVDNYLRTVAGNTQVNATDLRTMPFPTLSEIVSIGKALPDVCTLVEADEAVESILSIAKTLVSKIA